MEPACRIPMAKGKGTEVSGSKVCCVLGLIIKLTDNVIAHAGLCLGRNIFLTAIILLLIMALFLSIVYMNS